MYGIGIDNGFRNNLVLRPHKLFSQTNDIPKKFNNNSANLLTR